MNPKVNILIPTCNRPRLFEQAIQSVLAQTYDNLDIIVTDNSENDQTELIAAKYNGFKHLIRYYKNPANIGMTGNFIRCLELADGEYINYLMDDDLFHPQKIERMMACFLADPQVVLVTSNKEYINSENYIVDDTVNEIFNQDLIMDGLELGDIVLKNCTNYIGEPTAVLFKRSALTEPFGAYTGKIARNNSDVATWLNILRTGKAVYLSDCLSFIRIHENRVSETINSIVNEFSDWVDNIFDSRNDGYLKIEFDFRLCLQNLSRMLMYNNFRMNECQDIPLKEDFEYFFSRILYFLEYLKNYPREGFDDYLIQAVTDFCYYTRWISHEKFFTRFLNIHAVSKNRNILIWGTGNGGVRTLKFLRKKGICVQGFIDSNCHNESQLCQGLKINNPSILDDDAEKPYVVIGSSYCKEIQEKLQTLGFRYQTDFIENALLFL